MKSISVITPSIRPDGLKVTFETLQQQTFTDFEWLPRLSILGVKPDLCYQMNKALDEAQGSLVVFLQDWIMIEPTGLEMMWQSYLESPLTCWTAPVGKQNELGGPVRWDWRPFWKHREGIPYDHWEIDWGCAPRDVLVKEKFCEQYDDGFGWENVDLALRLKFLGLDFKVDPDNKAVAIDHDAHAPHPYKHKANIYLWEQRKTLLEYANSGDQNLGTTPQPDADSFQP